MSSGCSMRRLFAGVALSVLSAVPPTALATDPLPVGRKTDWTYTGVPGGIPNRTNICATFNPGVSATTISDAIGACSDAGGGVVYLNAGTYNVEGMLTSTTTT